MRYTKDIEIKSDSKSDRLVALLTVATVIGLLLAIAFIGAEAFKA